VNQGEAHSHPLALGRRLKEKLASGGTCAGAFLKIPSPDMVEVFAGTDLDFVRPTSLRRWAFEETRTMPASWTKSTALLRE
jgi:hypothetical protein